MTLEESYIELLKRIPGITDPIKKLTFKDKLKWTGIVLILYFVMSQIMAYGINQDAVLNFEFLEIILGSSFGSFITLGIGPIVTASIILQLLVGSKLIPWDLGTDKGRTLFQGTQKLFAFFLCLVEASIYVLMGAIPANTPSLISLVILQLTVGGILIIFMDEVISKWGFGSGVSLFIVAGVAKGIIIRTLNPLTQTGGFPSIAEPPSGLLLNAIWQLGSNPMGAFITITPIIATVIVFIIVVYTQSIRVEIPLAFGSVRGFGRRWPLKFFYTSNMPVILIGALLANLQMFANMASKSGAEWLGTFDANGNITGGIVYFLFPPTSQAVAGYMVMIGAFALAGAVLAYFLKKKNLGWKLSLGFGVLGGVAWYALMMSMNLSSFAYIPLMDIARIFTYSIIMIAGAMIFSIFWVQTSGMDSASVAKQIQSTGLQIPGYRRDIRVIERVLDKYIPPLAVIGGAAVGFVAAYADFTMAIGTGTGLLLATMIIYQLYEQIATQHMEDMNPALRRFMSK
ncbi:MAG: preprotein translocase subunit SecY [Candidatus Aenigmarchaeota archaeon]|nr:preprotein translocase subunit SecY [Candidatus Aenigmarchaeota archaeon]